MSEIDTYNAWEEDLATLNIFFGQETVMGEPKDADQQIFGKFLFEILKIYPVQSLREA